ncbi:MAG: hypothetical protein JST06_08025 [Bacteroidetes bacterium]|nr:hypothetical protein [Bacteroidota bacterium]
MKRIIPYWKKHFAADENLCSLNMTTPTMKALFTLIIFCGYAPLALAQLTISAVQDPFLASLAARHAAPYLGDGFDRFQVNVFNPYFSLGSNFTSIGDARDFLRSDVLSDELIGRNISKMHPTNNLITGSLDLALLNLAVRLGDEDAATSITLGAGVNERMELSTNFNRESFVLAYAGNEQFAGEYVELAPRFDALAFTEYYVAFACAFQSKEDGWSIKPAIRLSYLSGQVSVDMQQENSIAMYTDPEGRYLDFSLNYRINTSLGSDSVRLEGSSFNLNEKSLHNGLGSGFGLDLGLRLTPRPGLDFNVGLSDLGSIRFANNTTNIYNQSTYRYEGVDVNFVDEQHLSFDSLASFAKPNYAHEAYSVTLPTRLILSGSYGFAEVNAGNKHYFRHQVAFLYLQGFSNHLSATKTPYFGLGYTYSIGDMVHVGINGGIGGVFGPQLGLLGSIKAGPLRFGLQSNNILSLFSPQSGRGIDAGLLLALAF